MTIRSFWQILPTAFCQLPTLFSDGKNFDFLHKPNEG